MMTNEDTKLKHAKAMATAQGHDWEHLSGDARSIYLNLADACASVDAPPKATEPERSVRVLRGFVEILTVKDGKRGIHPLECSCVAEARKITAGWSRGGLYQPGSGLPIIELGPEAPEPQNGDASGYYICNILRDETGRRVFQKLQPQGHPQPEDWSAQWNRELAKQVSY